MGTLQYESAVHHAYLLVCMVGPIGSSALARTSTASWMAWARPVSIKANMPHGESSPTGQLELAHPARLPPSEDPRLN
jgi:hypothetical protein